jgi:hypothetical protein
MKLGDCGVCCGLFSTFGAIFLVGTAARWAVLSRPQGQGAVSSPRARGTTLPPCLSARAAAQFCLYGAIKSGTASISVKVKRARARGALECGGPRHNERWRARCVRADAVLACRMTSEAAHKTLPSSPRSSTVSQRPARVRAGAELGALRHARARLPPARGAALPPPAPPCSREPSHARSWFHFRVHRLHCVRPPEGRRAAIRGGRGDRECRINRDVLDTGAGVQAGCYARPGSSGAVQGRVDYTQEPIRRATGTRSLNQRPFVSTQHVGLHSLLRAAVVEVCVGRLQRAEHGVGPHGPLHGCGLQLVRVHREQRAEVSPLDLGGARLGADGELAGGQLGEDLSRARVSLCAGADGRTDLMEIRQQRANVGNRAVCAGGSMPQSARHGGARQR